MCSLWDLIYNIIITSSFKILIFRIRFDKNLKLLRIILKIYNYYMCLRSNFAFFYTNYFLYFTLYWFMSFIYCWYNKWEVNLNIYFRLLYNIFYLILFLFLFFFFVERSWTLRLTKIMISLILYNNAMSAISLICEEDWS